MTVFISLNELHTAKAFLFSSQLLLSRPAQYQLKLPAADLDSQPHQLTTTNPAPAFPAQLLLQQHYRSAPSQHISAQQVPAAKAASTQEYCISSIAHNLPHHCSIISSRKVKENSRNKTILFLLHLQVWILT
ncbi:unnamed protein product [Ilex paraguariensis]|uniref:Uncharacterized protein n=1 Tax=Ilex paraguariensis TaxID=185542 RepID=A0ABC8R7Q8_9AQUA